MVVIGALFITSEYRRGLIRTTLTASPRRGRVLAAKAVVLACVVFVLGLAASAFTMWFVDRQRRNNGTYIPPASALTELRVLAGTAAVLAVAAILALAIGTIVRRSATAVAAVIALTVLPYILGVSSIGALQWMLRVTPAAGFAVQQTLHQYPQVDGVYIASAGYYPLSPWAGFAVSARLDGTRARRCSSSCYASEMHDLHAARRVDQASNGCGHVLAVTGSDRP